MRYLLFILTVLLITTQFNCRKVDVVNTSETINDFTTITSSIKGVVVNENEIPVMGATVTLGNNNVVTNALGTFEFRNQTMSKNNTHVKVEKEGYFTGNRTTTTSTGRTQLMRIKLIPKNTTGTVNAASGGSVSLASGAKVNFQAGSFIDAGGTAYNGTVNVAMVWIDPTANDLGQIIPGDLRGIAATGGERVLETFGMLGVEITNPAGQKLKLVSGKPAELRFPIPAALQASAPFTIPLWDFDEAAGRWKEEGNANKVGNEYVGNVTHFSFWNADVPANFINLCVTVLTQSGQPLINVPVRVRRASTPAVSATDYTDSTGTNCGAVFKNEPLILEILDRCGNVVYTQNIGPYSANASITVNINSANTSTISGSVVNCSNVPLTSGNVIITTTAGHNYSLPISTNGTYSLAILNCGNTSINYTIIAIDNATLQQSVPASGVLTSGHVTVSTLQTCASSPDSYIQLIVNGVPHLFVTPNHVVWSTNNSNITPPLANATNFGGRRTDPITLYDEIYFSFSHNNTIGTYPLSSFYFNFIYPLPNSPLIALTHPNSTVTVTSISATIPSYIEGNFSVAAVERPSNTLKNYYVKFRVLRQ